MVKRKEEERKKPVVVVVKKVSLTELGQGSSIFMKCKGVCEGRWPLYVLCQAWLALRHPPHPQYPPQPNLFPGHVVSFCA